MPSTRTASKKQPKVITVVNLFVTVANKRIPVAVSEGGVFHDMSGKHSATTLKGLEQRMNKVNQIKGAVPIEKDDGSKQGIVVSYDSDYNRYRVKWDNGKSGYAYSNNLRRRTTAEERQHLADLETASNAAEQAAEDAYKAMDDYHASLDVSQLLKDVFGS